MLRFFLSFVAAAFALCGASEAAGLFNPSKTLSAKQQGVTVWRGAKPAVDAPDDALIAGVPAKAALRITIGVVAFPERRLRTHGFSAGDGFETPAERVARDRHLHGFYARRMAAGD